MRRRLMAVGLALALAASTGCGGGDSSGSDGAVTVTDRVDTFGTKTAVDPKVLALRKKRAEFRRYMAQTRESLKSYRTALRLEDQVFSMLFERTPSQEDRKEAARLLTLAATRFDQSGLLQFQAQPPRSLRAVNKQFAANSTRAATHERALALAATSNNWPQSWTDAQADYKQTGIRAQWRTETDAYARTLGLTMPPWSRIIGQPQP